MRCIKEKKSFPYVLNVCSPRALRSSSPPHPGNLALDILPSRGERQEERDATARDCDGEGNPQALHVRGEDTGDLLGGKDVPQVCGARDQHEGPVDRQRVDGEFMKHLVGEAGLAGRDEDGAADGLEEEDHGRDGGDVRGLDDGLAHDDGDLEDQA